ncbi:MAG: hypothetical protein IJX99_04520 [Clostridia bacterium]|nr:hypothetical protein [Clostridia bacterium]
MDRYDEVLTKCRNYPKDMSLGIPGKPELFPVSPHEFRNLCEGIALTGCTVDAVHSLQTMTERYKHEYTLVLYGNTSEDLDTLFMKEYCLNPGRKGEANFSYQQLDQVKRTLRKRGGEVVYAHTHIACGTQYNCFSLNDLKYLIRRAYITNRDTYGLLITKDGFSPIKYSIQENEFFRIQILFA